MNSAILLGVDPLAPPEEHRAAMWALWHGKRLAIDTFGMTRADRFALLDAISEQCSRDEAPAVIEMWQSDSAYSRGMAYQTHLDLQRDGRAKR